MSFSLPWLVLFFFTIIGSLAVLVYEMRSKFKWKTRTFYLEKENEELKRQVSNPASLQREYNSALIKIEKKLTKRQFEIFIYTIDGLSTKEIAEKINISSGTINSHINEVKLHLNVEKRTQFAGVLFGELRSSF